MVECTRRALTLHLTSSFGNDYPKRIDDELDVIPEVGILHILQILFDFHLHDDVYVVVL